MKPSWLDEATTRAFPEYQILANFVITNVDPATFASYRANDGNNRAAMIERLRQPGSFF